MREERFAGGNLSDATRVGDTVRRRTGPWTPAVHSLLRFLERAGFDAPRVLGVDERGREILAYIEGDAYPGWPEPRPDWVVDDERLAQGADLLRRYHETVIRYEPPPDARWRLTAPTAHELICHNDWAPWNALFGRRQLAVMLDWDNAGPGSRLWDVTNAAYSWVPLISGDKTRDVVQEGRRLRLFCDAYGLRDRGAVLDTMRLRIAYVSGWIAEHARLGDPGFMKLAGWDTPARMLRDVAYLNEHRAALERALD